MSNYYIKQLKSGEDFGKQNPIAGQMANFVYLVGDRVKENAWLLIQHGMLKDCSMCQR